MRRLRTLIYGLVSHTELYRIYPAYSGSQTSTTTVDSDQTPHNAQASSSFQTHQRVVRRACLKFSKSMVSHKVSEHLGRIRCIRCGARERTICHVQYAICWQRINKISSGPSLRVYRIIGYDNTKTEGPVQTARIIIRLFAVHIWYTDTFL